MSANEIILTESQNAELDNLADMYFEAVSECNSATAKKDAFNCMLKDMLKEYGVSKYVSTNGISLSVSSRPNIKWDEDKLLAFCKTLNVDGLVKTKEYVDMDALESAIYNSDIQAEQLKPFQIVKPDIITLRCTQKQKLNE
jgi:hypothetical protein